ncbi:protein of unknown function (DUF4260) [Shewanella psychrophila]|uniref:DUF4260 family protein n=1 Tax=Shewanella psychrophila TaxID=225848 RepID=A0A1S6HIU9_9GAMM|nr:DUF4260 domain-containing protein [Shewanella psychrophila]AQS35428.1 protein of unknown function (DUF4260) [Shewanella psychrophila]
MSEVTGKIRTTLRVEGLVILLASLLIYHKFSFSWSEFAWFFLAPDLALLAYIHSAKLGSLAYNLSHSFIGPLVTLLFGVLGDSQVAIQISLIWCGHIGFDRALGYGLKYSKGFSYTHLGQIGKSQKT